MTAAPAPAVNPASPQSVRRQAQRVQLHADLVDQLDGGRGQGGRERQVQRQQRRAAQHQREGASQQQHAFERAGVREVTVWVQTPRAATGDAAHAH